MVFKRLYQGGIAVEDLYRVKLCILVTVFTTLVFGFALSGPAVAEDHYWVPKDPPKSHYRIEVRIDVENFFIEGKQKVVFQNDSVKPIGTIAFDWVISDKSSIDVSVAGKTITSLNEASNAPTTSPLFYKLPEPVGPGTKVELKVGFKAKDLFSDRFERFYISSWHPRLWWDGLAIHDSFQVKLEVPREFTPATSGVLNEETGFYESDRAKSFGIYLGRNLKTEQREVDGILITSLYSEKGTKTAKFCLETAEDIVRFYKEWLGFYPFKFLNIVAGESKWRGGFSFATGIVAINGQEDFEGWKLEWWKWIVAHEIGHEYWGQYVMEGNNPPWLWIGMGMHADAKWCLDRHGINRHEPQLLDFLYYIYQYSDLTIDVPPARLEQLRYSFGGPIAHGKALFVVSALECVLGEDVFDKVYKKCLHDFVGKRFGYRDLWRVSEEVSGRNLNWFFEQWVRSNKILCYQIDSQDCVRTGDKFISTIKVKCGGTLKMPVPVKAIFEDGSEQVKLTSRELDVTTLVFESSAKLKEAILNPGNRLAMVDRPLTPLPEEASEILALGWPKDFEKVKTVYELIKDKEVNSDYLWFKLGRKMFDNKLYSEAFNCFKNVTGFDLQGEYKFEALVWMAVAKDIMGERDSALALYQESLNYEPKYVSTYKSYGITTNHEWVKERLKTPYELEKE